MDIGSSDFFYLAFTGFNNKEHMTAIHKVQEWHRAHPTQLVGQVYVNADPNLNFVAPQLQFWQPGQALHPSAVPLTSDGKIRVRLLQRRMHATHMAFRAGGHHLSVSATPLDWFGYE